jgi:hypothetical protein
MTLAPQILSGCSGGDARDKKGSVSPRTYHSFADHAELGQRRIMRSNIE